MAIQKMYEVLAVLIFTDDETEKIKKVKERYLITDAVDPQDAYTQAYTDLSKIGGQMEFEISSVKESNIIKVIDNSKK